MQEPIVEVTENTETKMIEVRDYEGTRTFKTVQEAIRYATDKYLGLLNTFGCAKFFVQRKMYYHEKD